MAGINAEILPSSKFAAHVISKSVRPEDAEEIWVSTLQTPADAMRLGMEYSEESYAGYANGIPVCMWGVVKECLLFNNGTPWMVASSKLDDPDITRAFLRRCRNGLMDMFKNYDTLENYVDARNTRSIKWLKFMGFQIGEPEPYGVLQMPFHRFWMNKENRDV